MCVIIFQKVDSLWKRYQTPRDIKMKYRSLTENYGLDIAKNRRYYVRFSSAWTSLKYPLLQFVDTWYANAKYCSPQLKFHIDMTVNWYCCHFPHGADRSILKLGLSLGLFLFNNTKIHQFLLFPYAEFFFVNISNFISFDRFLYYFPNKLVLLCHCFFCGICTLLFIYKIYIFEKFFK